MKNPDELWFNTVFPGTLCRGGGNGPNHPSQLYAVRKYVKEGMSFLDVGCGNATTAEALKDAQIKVKYKGVDMIPKHIEWCKQAFPEFEFAIEDGEELSEKDQSWDVVYSRHVIDHMPSFERALDEHCRVAGKLVIAILWYSFCDQDEHIIKNIVDGPLDARVTYSAEYLNQYSRPKVKEYLENKKGWRLLELTEGFQNNVGGAAQKDTIIVLERI